MAEAIPASSIKRFDGSNYESWKFNMVSLFQAHELVNMIDGSTPRPVATATNEAEVKRWIRLNGKAKVMISSSLEDKQTEPVLTCVTAKEMWDKLSLIHEQKSESNKLGLLQKFYAHQMSTSDTALQHVTNIQNLAAQLNDVGQEMSETVVMAKVLSSLTSKFSNLQTAWDSVDPARQTMDNLQERLIREDLRLAGDDDSASALAATKNKRQSKKRSTKKDKKDVECYKCHEKGHYARACKKGRGKKKGDEDDSSDCAFVANSEVKKKDKRVSNERAETMSKQQRELMAVSQSDAWLTDSGASRHLTYRREWFTDYRANGNGDTIALGDDGVCDIAGEGTVTIRKLIDGVWRDARIEDVLYVPKLRKNLFSVGVCTNKGLEVRFCGNNVNVMRNNKVIASGAKQGNDIYRMFFKVVEPGNNVQANVSSTNLSVWHERLGHVGHRAIRELVKKGLVNGVTLTDKSDIFCEPCKFGKSHRLPFKKKVDKVPTVPGEVIHTDVSGRMSVESLNQNRYFLTFKDDATSYRHVYFIRHKSDVFEKFREFEKLISNKFGRSMRKLKSDHGGEYIGDDMKEYLKSRGITSEKSAPYTPEQNGFIERDNRTIVESARTMIHAKSLPVNLWEEAVKTAVYVLNRSVWSKNSVTPYEAWVGKTPDLKHLRIFGSEAFVHIPKQFTRKLDVRARKTILVGYEGDSANYRVYDPASKRISITRDVTFRERIGKVTSPLDERKDNNEFVIEIPENKLEESEDDTSDEDEPEAHEDAEAAAEGVNENGEDEARPPEVEPRNLRDRRTLRLPARYEVDVAEYVATKTFQEAMTGQNATQWAKAVKEELDAHERSSTWTLVTRAESQKTIDSKWLFKVKTNPEGKPVRHKARLCARGFRQEHGVDYYETFSPVVRYDSLRVLLATVAQQDLEITQFDVQSAFLNGELKETIYMEVPEGLVVEGEAEEDSEVKRVVCKLERPLYGLKQAPRCWNQKFTRFLNEFNLKECDADKCVFVGSVRGEKVYLALFVDDGLVAASSKQTLDKIVTKLESAFRITISDSSMFVGVQIARNRAEKSLVIHQSSYTKKIIEKFGMRDANSGSVPADPHAILSITETDESKETTNVPYREAVGSLVFLATVSRPDISYAVNVVSKYLGEHNQSHWRAVRRIFAYLVGTVSTGIEYRDGGSMSELVGFSDADYAGDVDTRRSTTGFVFCLADGAVTWSSQRQKMVTLSTTEAEYVAACAAAKESVWLRKLLSDIGHPCTKETVLYVDNESAIQLVKNPVYHKRTKHIDVRFHYTRERVENKEIIVTRIDSENQRADIFTKALHRDRFLKLCASMNVKQYVHNA